MLGLRGTEGAVAGLLLVLLLLLLLGRSSAEEVGRRTAQEGEYHDGQAGQLNEANRHADRSRLDLDETVLADGLERRRT